MWRGFNRRQDYGATMEEDTGSESEYKGSWGAEYTGVEGCTGHPIPVGTVAAPFYGVNAARLNGSDIEPIPITPVRGQNWPEMQIQLNNGWGTLSFGKKLSYDDYLRLITDSATKNRNFLIPNPSGLGPAAQRPGPAPGNVQQLINNGAGKQPNTPGGPGFLAGNVNLSGRTYYG
jgi:hypothetical protein